MAPQIASSADESHNNATDVSGLQVYNRLEDGLNWQSLSVEEVRVGTLNISTRIARDVGVDGTLNVVLRFPPPSLSQQYHDG